MTEYLDREDVLAVAARIFGGQPPVRDFGLLESAVARPRTTVYGVDAYPTPWSKAAALLHSLARNYSLSDGNKRTAWACAWLFLGRNGIRLDHDFDVDVAERMMNDVARGVHDDDLGHIAATLRSFESPAPR